MKSVLYQIITNLLIDSLKSKNKSIIKSVIISTDLTLLKFNIDIKYIITKNPIITPIN